MAGFADINVSQGSVATHAGCDGSFNTHLTTTLQRNFPVNLKKLFQIWQNYCHESVAHFLAHPVLTFCVYGTFEGAFCDAKHHCQSI